ncbi:MAG TPA: gamma-glutamyl-gamma-aminobutyrate hydrolase family protein [Rhodospirillales bacterium]|nr:gamma-glutamyl-gamma-aminobutyrate hydrolase family protein [Rhodospirillales bacterium]
MNTDKTRTLTPPLIGITLDWQAASKKKSGYSNLPWYALRQNYCDAVAAAGGLPMPLPHNAGLAAEYLEVLDGLLLTGGDFDIDPALFGATTRHATVKVKEARTAFEMAAVRRALELDMPVLGICGGLQLLHVALGGTLIQHIPDAVPGGLAHEQPNPRHEPGHSVTIAPATLLHDIVGSGEMTVNSAHHQAAADAPGDTIINAHAADGVIEGIEGRGLGFCLGVQWHPEYEVDPGDVRIFAAFVDAARNYRA